MYMESNQDRSAISKKDRKRVRADSKNEQIEKAEKVQILLEF